MQTKKRVVGTNSSRERTSPRFSRHQKKVPENVQVQEKKVSELITSSARKQRFAGTLQKNTGDCVAAANLNTIYELVDDDTSVVCLGHNDDDAINNATMDSKGYDDAGDRAATTIFSPSFHIPRIAGGQISNEADFYKFFQNGDQQFQGDEKENLKGDLMNSHVIQEEKNSNEDAMTSTTFISPDLEEGGLSSEVSAIYLSMKNSKLECVDECNQMSTDVCPKDDESEEFDDFDPYLFIKNLPNLSSVVPTFRPVLLPKQTRRCPPTTLVLDLDETLVHSTLEPCDGVDFTFSVKFNLMEHTIFVRCRPYLKDFMERVSGLFEIIIFTASQSIYAEQLLNVLDPKRKVFRHRVYRESCVFVEGNYVKDLSVLGRDLRRVIIIDNSPQAFGFQIDNGIPIESWFEDRSDKELLSILPFLESLVGAEDVRPLIAKKFNLRDRIAAAAYPFNSRGNPYEM